MEVLQRVQAQPRRGDEAQIRQTAQEQTSHNPGEILKKSTPVLYLMRTATPVILINAPTPIQVHSARRCLRRPVVIDGELEPGSRLWCCCCELEVARHTTDGDVSIEWGGFLQHMTWCVDHVMVM